MRKHFATLSALSLLALAALPALPHVQALDTVPATTVYNGHLLNSSGNAITTAHNIRFSYWTSVDAIAGDQNGDGTINTLAANYAGWQEVHTVTPDSNGYFSVQLGSVTPLPDFALPGTATSTLTNLALQIDVKEATQPDTSYELLDCDAASATKDRSPVLTVPFAHNADLLDQREIGTGSGAIPLLQSGGLLTPSMIPGGTNQGIFTIDIDNTETGDIILEFGDTLAKQLAYDQANSYFKFNDDVRIEGNLFVTGTINGVDFSSFSDDAHLKVSSGGGLDVNVSNGGYRINGSNVDYAGVSGVALPDDDTSYLFFTSTGIQVNQIGFPSGKSFIPLAEVTTAGGEVTTIDDERVFQEDDRESTVTRTLHPLFQGASYKGDGTNNVGRLVVDHDAATDRNFYNWSSTSAGLQDYDILTRIELPRDFVRFEDPTIEVRYRTSTANAAENAIDIEVFDTAGSAITLSGSVTNLVSTTWATTRIEFTGNPTLDPEGDILLKITPKSQSQNQAHIGDVHLHHRAFYKAPNS